MKSITGPEQVLQLESQSLNYINNNKIINQHDEPLQNFPKGHIKEQQSD